MKFFLILIFSTNIYSAEFPLIRVSGKLTFLDKVKICIGEKNNETCFKRLNKYESFLSKGQIDFDLLIDNQDILWEPSHD